MKQYIGQCMNPDCEMNGVEQKFSVPPDKDFENQPPICSKCGKFLVGGVYDAATEEEAEKEQNMEGKQKLEVYILKRDLAYFRARSFFIKLMES